MAIPGYDFNRILSGQQRPPQQVLPDIGVSQSFNPTQVWDQGVSLGGTPAGTPTIIGTPTNGTPAWAQNFNPNTAWNQSVSGTPTSSSFLDWLNTPMSSTPSKYANAVPGLTPNEMGNLSVSGMGSMPTTPPRTNGNGVLPTPATQTGLDSAFGRGKTKSVTPPTEAGVTPATTPAVKATTPVTKRSKNASTGRSSVGSTSALGSPSIPSIGTTGSGINLNFGYTPDLGFTSSFSSVIDPSLLSGLDSSIQALRSPSTSVGATRSPMGPAYEPEPSMFNTLASWGGEVVDMLNPFSDDITPGATDYNQGFLSPEAQLRLFGGTDADGNKYRGALGPLTRGLGVLFRGWTGKESIDIAKDMAAGQQAAYQQNMQAQAQAYNTALEAQYRSQSGEYEGKDEDVAKYMEENGIKV